MGSQNDRRTQHVALSCNSVCGNYEDKWADRRFFFRATARSRTALMRRTGGGAAGSAPLALRYALAPFSPVRSNLLHQRISRSIQIVDSRRETALGCVIEQIIGG